jgi:hypothetical protein
VDLNLLSTGELPIFWNKNKYFFKTFVICFVSSDLYHCSTDNQDNWSS